MKTQRMVTSMAILVALACGTLTPLAAYAGQGGSGGAGGAGCAATNPSGAAIADGAIVATTINAGQPPCPNPGPGTIPGNGPFRGPALPVAGAPCSPWAGASSGASRHVNLTMTPVGNTILWFIPNRPTDAQLPSNVVDDSASQNGPPGVNIFSTLVALLTMQQHEGVYGVYGIASVNGPSTWGPDLKCHTSLSYSPAVFFDQTKPVTTAGGPPVNSPAPPNIQGYAQTLVQQWQAGSVMTTPANTFYTWTPVCVYLQGGTVPVAAKTVQIIQPEPFDPVTGRQIVVQYTITLTPQQPVVVWGDGTTSPISATAPQPVNPPNDCQNTHMYKQVSGEPGGGPAGGLTFQVTQQVTLTANVQYFDGTATTNYNVALGAPVTLTWATSGPHVIKQIEPGLQS